MSRFLLAILVAALPLALSAQDVSASITGEVKDATGAVIPGATITVTNLDTSITRTAVSGSGGDYLIPLLRPGRYSLSVTQKGFKTHSEAGIVLELNQKATRDVALQIGDVSDRVEVTTELPLISTEDSAIGKVIDNKSIMRIPLNGRLSIQGLIALAPGIQNSGAQDGIPNFGITPTVSGGSNTGSVAFSLDGVTNSTAWIERGFGEYPPLDGLQEFKVITSSANAEFGKAAQVIVVTRGGTNAVHGTLLAFNRNRFLAAKNFFATQLPTPVYNRNEFGGNFSGPIHFPRLYSGRNRSFFFMNYEGFRLIQAQTTSAQVATAAMRQGNFAGLAPINDPLAGAPFAGNVIPPTRLNPVTARLGQLYPLANTAGTGPAGTGVNLVENTGIPQGVERGSFRLDHKLSENDQLSYSMMFGYLGPNPSVGATSKFGGMAGIGEHNINSTLSLNHVFTPTVISETRLGYLHVRIFRKPQNFALGTSGIIPGLPAQPIDGAPQISITNIVGMSEAGSSDLTQNISLIENVTVTRGAHTLKAGLTYNRAMHYNIAATSPQRGAYAFNGRYSGAGYGDFALGYPNTTQLPSPTAIIGKFAANRVQTFLQDDWRITGRLTLSAGLRHEFQGVRPEVRNLASLFIPAANKVAVFADNFPPQVVQPALAAYPVVLSKTLGLPTYAMDYVGENNLNFAPRLGLAYKLRRGTVLRAGSGLYWNSLNLNYMQSAEMTLPFLVAATFEQPAGSIPAITMNNPFPGSGAVPANPSANTYGRMATPYNLQWNATVEHELLRAVALRLSYVGQRNVKQLGNANINQPLPSPGAVQPNRPYQPFAAITRVNSPIFQSTSSQLQAGVERRYSSGLLLTAQFQYSRVLGVENFMRPNNYTDSRGNLGGIRRHVLVTSYVYDLPFGKGKLLLNNASPLLNRIAGGWQFSGIAQALSGSPFSPSFDTSVVGSVGGRPNRVLGETLYPSERTLLRYFNPGAFSVPANFTYGNASYNLLWGPGQWTWDMSLAKHTALTERASLELRLDAFSAFNHPTFGNPSANITNTAVVGRITSAGGTRTVQIGARLTF